MIDLSITQQFLTLAVNDKGKLSTFDQNGEICLIAGGVIELAQAGVIEIRDKRATTREKLPRELDYLAPLYDYIREKEPVKANWIVNDFYMSITGKRFNALFDGVMDSLRAQGLTEMVESGFLGRDRSPAPKEKAVRAVVDNLRAELLDDDPVDAETAVVAVLLDKSDDLKEHFSKDERRAMKERLKNLAQTPEGKLIASAVEQVETIAVILLTTIL